MTFDGGVTPVNVRCLYNDVEVSGCTFKNVIGAAREVTACQFYMDGQSDQVAYQAVGNVKFSGNHVERVVQRNTNGDSTSGNNYECCGFRGGGQNVQVLGNKFKDITGVDFDCEAIYTKAVRYMITDNICKNAGTEEGAINAKGISPENSQSGSSAPGYWGIIKHNQIFFDRYSYDYTAEHGAGAVETLRRTGINCSAADSTSISDNLIVGANEHDIRVQGNENSPQALLQVKDNRSRDFLGDVSIILRGAFEDMDVCENSCVTSENNPAGTCRYILYEVTANHGLTRDRNRFNGNRLVFNDPTFTGTIALPDLGMNNYAFNVLQANDNIWDVTVDNAAQQNPCWLRDTGSGAATFGDRFEMKGWIFTKTVTDASFQPLRWQNLGAGRVRDYDIDIRIRWEVNDNTSRTVCRFRASEDNAIGVDMDYIAMRTDQLGPVLKEKRSMTGFDKTGDPVEPDGLVASAGLTEHSESVGTAALVSAFLQPSGRDIIARINGNDNETWRFDLQLRARALCGASA